MDLTFAALRTTAYATGFLWFWAWITRFLRPLDSSLGGPLPDWNSTAVLAALAGAAVTAWCLVAFVVRGRGTPALFDAPRRLVAWGPYRYTRNPMYLGVAILLFGFGLSQRSPSIVLFVPVWWALSHLLVVLYEERALRRKFGPDYDAYCRQTPRWIPRSVHPASAGAL